ncbi:hypothetical protein L7F22_028770 [Adiantum nelumboides]|nr:hypothetical protein [Adiantum nelumboides]
MEESHVPPYDGHRGIDATVKVVETFFYWPTLRGNVEAFVRACIIFQKVKFDRQKAPGLLQPLPIPDKPWEIIAMDFIFELPRTQTRNDGIWTIIYRFSKQAHLIFVRKKIKPDQMARLFMSNIFKYHGVSQSIVSDHDPCMTSLFWRGLFENTGTMLKFSSSFHPQTDGQFEEANSTVLGLLKCYLSEHKAKWEQYLPLVEYAYNNTVHPSTGKTPFEIVDGGKKVPPILHTKDKIFEADKYVQVIDEMYKKIHNAFLVSLLRPYVGDVPEDMPVEEQPEVEELVEILVPEQILAHKERKVKGKVARRYLVKFRNYPPMDAKWMEEGELAESPNVLSLYLEAFWAIFHFKRRGGVKIKDGCIFQPSQVVMYDEPTAGLDPIASTVVEDLIRSVHINGRDARDKPGNIASYIVVTHQHSTIRRAVDRLLFLHEGRILWEGRTAEFDTTTDPIVRQFVDGSLKGPIKY